MMHKIITKANLFPSETLSPFLGSLSTWTPSLKHTLGPCAWGFLNLTEKLPPQAKWFHWASGFNENPAYRKGEKVINVSCSKSFGLSIWPASTAQVVFSCPLTRELPSFYLHLKFYVHLRVLYETILIWNLFCKIVKVHYLKCLSINLLTLLVIRYVFATVPTQEEKAQCSNIILLIYFKSVF